MDSKQDLTIHASDKQLVTKCDQFMIPIESRILTLRGRQVMIDRDLAELYDVETKRLNEQVKRNIERFPDSFRFQLTNVEKEELVANCDRFKGFKHSSVNPYAFTEQGVAMLSAVLKSETAVRTSIRIIEAFVAMRNFLMDNASIFQRMERIEMKQLRTDEKVDAILDKLNDKSAVKQGLFFDGQIFDAYALVCDLIQGAKKRIVVIDNYADYSVLRQLDKREKSVAAIVYTSDKNEVIKNDIKRHNAQYPQIELKIYSKAHDRFLIIDNTIYHIGASLKDLGKKIFGFNKMEEMTADELLKRINSKN